MSDVSLKDAQTKSLCYERPTDSQSMLRKTHRLTVYATKDAQTKSLCYERPTDSQSMLRKMHKLKVYATKDPQTHSLCYSIFLDIDRNYSIR